MAKFKLIALTNAVSGRETDFDAWYQDQHLPDLLKVAGVQSAQRYTLAATLNGGDVGSHLAIYDVECDNAADFLAELGAAASTMVMTDAMDDATGYAGLFLEHGAAVSNQR